MARRVVTIRMVAQRVCVHRAPRRNAVELRSALRCMPERRGVDFSRSVKIGDAGDREPAPRAYGRAAHRLRSAVAAMKTRPTVQRSLVLDAGLDKLQAFLLGMVPGDEVSVRRAMEISGLDASQCDAVLDALARAGLMMRLQHDAYVRRSLD